MNCPFCNKTNLLIEKENVCAFLDINPVAEGHTLIITKDHYETIVEVPDAILGELLSLAKERGKQLLKEGATGFNILNASGKDAQQSVPHVHLHVVPRKKDDGLDLWLR